MQQSRHGPVVAAGRVGVSLALVLSPMFRLSIYVVWAKTSVGAKRLAEGRMGEILVELKAQRSKPSARWPWIFRRSMCLTAF